MSNFHATTSISNSQNRHETNGRQRGAIEFAIDKNGTMKIRNLGPVLITAGTSTSVALKFYRPANRGYCVPRRDLDCGSITLGTPLSVV